jgi:hypothetical protein
MIVCIARVDKYCDGVGKCLLLVLDFVPFNVIHVTLTAFSAAGWLFGKKLPKQHRSHKVSAKIARQLQ